MVARIQALFLDLLEYLPQMILICMRHGKKAVYLPREPRAAPRLIEKDILAVYENEVGDSLGISIGGAKGDSRSGAVTHSHTPSNFARREDDLEVPYMA